MKSETITIVQPRYMRKFHCTGSECEDNCCHGWRVIIDPFTAEKYRKITDPELKPIFDTHLIEKDGVVSIKHKDDGKCPFLDGHGLCKIHSKLGAEYLSDTCSVYPRVFNNIDNTLELSAVPSCPEVTALLLLNNDSMELEKTEINKDTQMILTSSSYPSDPKNSNSPQEYIHEIRAFLFSHLKNSSYSLEERLLIYGSVANDMDTLCREKRSFLIPAYLEQVRVSLNDNSLVSPIKERVNSRTQTEEAEMLMAILTLAKEKELGKDVTLLSLQAFVGYGGSKEWAMSSEDMKDIEMRYRYFGKEYLEPHFKNRNMLENLLLFYFFNKLMPGNHKENSAWGSFIDLYTVYKISTTFLYGIAGCNGGMSEKTVLRFIVVFSRLIFHSGSFNEYREMFKSLLRPVGIFNLDELQ